MKVIDNPVHVKEIFRRVEDFPPHNALTTVVPMTTAALRILAKVGFALPPVLASAVGEQHRTARRVVQKFFTPAKVRAASERISQLCKETAENLDSDWTPGTTVDACANYADLIPPIIMSELTGLPLPNLKNLKVWSQDSLELFWGWPDEDRQLVLAESAAEFYRWLRENVEAQNDPDTLFGALKAAGLSVTQTCSLGYFLVIAGQETTAMLIGTCIFRALENPSTWAELAGGGSAAQHVQYVLSTEPSVHTWKRTVEADTEFHGCPIKAGEDIVLELSHDETSTSPLAFGYGIHRCLGANLAELEAILALEAFAVMAGPNAQLADPDPDWVRLLSFQAPRSVTVQR